MQTVEEISVFVCPELQRMRTEEPLRGFRTPRKSVPPPSPPLLLLRLDTLPYSLCKWCAFPSISDLFHTFCSLSSLFFYCLYLCNISVCAHWAHHPLNSLSPPPWIVSSFPWLQDLSLTLWVFIGHWSPIQAFTTRRFHLFCGAGGYRDSWQENTAN